MFVEKSEEYFTFSHVSQKHRLRELMLAKNQMILDLNLFNVVTVIIKCTH